MTHAERPRIEHADPVKAAAEACRRWNLNGYIPPDHVLAKMVEAVYATADGVIGVKQAAPRRQWDDPPGRDLLRVQLNRKLIAGLLTTGRLPTALPTEEIRYYDGRFATPESLGQPVPAELIAAGYNDWDLVEVELWCPYRTLPVDRAAAVRAGAVASQ